MYGTGTILVTGGAGFIGANFVLDWISLAHGTVVNLDKLTYAGNRDNLASLAGNLRHIFVEGDIADTALVTKLLSEHRPVAVLNFAAESHVDRSIHGPAEFISTNIVGTYRLLESACAYFQNIERLRTGRLPLPPRFDRRGLWLPGNARATIRRIKSISA